MPRLVKDTVPSLTYELEKHKTVMSAFPNASVHYYKGFQSRDVNKNYTSFSFDRNNWGCWVLFFHELPFTYEGKTEIIKVYSAPQRNRMCYIDYVKGGRILKFSKVVFNLKNNKFVSSEQLMTAIRVEISKFIQDTKLPIDDKHLDPRIKNLISFA